jgi:hypothetical protein
MKKLLVVTGLVLSSIVSYSQSRVNKSEIKWSENYTPLTNATGWIQDEKSGKWISGVNVIKEEFYDIEYTNQFNSIQFRGFDYKEKKYYAMVIKKIGVYWDYPTIGRGFHTYPKTLIYVLPSEEFNKLKTVNDEYTINTIIAGDNMEYEQGNETFIKNSVRMFMEETKNDSEYYNHFKVIKTKSNGKDVYRFNLPEDSLEEVNFKKMYFEVGSINKFTTLLK